MQLWPNPADGFPPVRAGFRIASRIIDDRAETVFDDGLRQAQVASTRATYDESVANYRQTVLTGFQQVEDQLAALRVLELEAKAQDAAEQTAREATQLALNEYTAGTIAYTAVTAQTAQLNNERSAVAVRQNRLTSSVALIEALGGGWTTQQLPDQTTVRSGSGPSDEISSRPPASS
jgi:outer membrane protein TolC